MHVFLFGDSSEEMPCSLCYDRETITKRTCTLTCGWNLMSEMISGGPFRQKAFYVDSHLWTYLYHETKLMVMWWQVERSLVKITSFQNRSEMIRRFIWRRILNGALRVDIIQKYNNIIVVNRSRAMSIIYFNLSGEWSGDDECLLLALFVLLFFMSTSHGDGSSSKNTCHNIVGFCISAHHDLNERWGSVTTPPPQPRFIHFHCSTA